MTHERNLIIRMIQILSKDILAEKTGPEACRFLVCAIRAGYHEEKVRPLLLLVPAGGGGTVTTTSE